MCPNVPSEFIRKFTGSYKTPTELDKADVINTHARPYYNVDTRILQTMTDLYASEKEKRAAELVAASHQFRVQHRLVRYETPDKDVNGNPINIFYLEADHYQDVAGDQYKGPVTRHHFVLATPIEPNVQTVQRLANTTSINLDSKDFQDWEGIVLDPEENYAEWKVYHKTTTEDFEAEYTI